MDARWNPKLQASNTYFDGVDQGSLIIESTGVHLFVHARTYTSSMFDLQGSVTIGGGGGFTPSAK